MSRSRLVATIVFGLALGLGPVAILSTIDGAGGSSPNRSPGDEELIWPYCAPDASPPSYESLPPSALLGDRIFEPVAEAIVPIRGIPDARSMLDEPGFEGVQIGNIETGEPIFESGSLVTTEVFPTAAVAAQDIVWTAAESASSSGHSLYLAVDAVWDDGTLSAAFLIDETAERFITSQWGNEPNPLLDEFIAIERRGDDSGGFIGLITEWNSAAAGQSKSDLVNRWSDYLQQRIGLGVSWPEPGTRAYWNSAPELCRSLLDAPRDVTAQLVALELEIVTPTSIRNAEDAVICLRLDGVGAAGCSALDASDDGVLRMEAWTDGLGALRVQLALSSEEATSWVKRTDIAVIEPHLLTEGELVRVIMDESVAGSTYTEIAESIEQGASPSIET